MTLLTIYIINVYLYCYFEYKEDEVNEQKIYAFVMLIGLLPPLLYEAVKMHTDGLLNYFRNFGNLPQLLYIVSSGLMTVLHIIMDPLTFGPKIILLFVLIFSIIRTFK